MNSIGNDVELPHKRHMYTIVYISIVNANQITLLENLTLLILQAQALSLVLGIGVAEAPWASELNSQHAKN